VFVGEWISEGSIGVVSGPERVWRPKLQGEVDSTIKNDNMTQKGGEEVAEALPFGSAE